jgi:sulfite reductase (NADPH) flavoprotein alpha-component
VIGIVPENDPALVARIVRAAGLREDAALTEALTRRYDISTLTVKQLKDYAALTGDKTLAALADDNEKRSGFIEGRQIIDLLETFPHALEAEPFTALLRPLAPRYYSVASSQRLVEEEAHLTIARLAYKSAWRRTGARPAAAWMCS